MKEKKFKKLLNKQKKLLEKSSKLETKIEKIKMKLATVEDQIYEACCEADWEQDYKNQFIFPYNEMNN